MIRSLLAFYLLSLCIVSNAQQRFYYSNAAKFLKPGLNDTLKFAYTGGFNTPQISNIDFNLDGKNDVFIFDKASRKVNTFTRKGNGFVHTPQYEGKFPPMVNWALLRDYNNDGKADLMTEVSFDRRYLVDTIQRPFGNGLRILKNTSTPGNFSLTPISNQVKDTGGTWGPPSYERRSPANIYLNASDVPAIDDVDNDGDIDILAMQGTSSSFTYYENFVKNKWNIPSPKDTTLFILRDQCWGYVNYDFLSGKNKFLLGQEKDKIPGCFFQMYGKAAKHAGTATLFLDYNGDGIKDVIYSDNGFSNLIILYNTRSTISGRDSIISQDSLFPSNTVSADFIMFPVPYYVDIDGDNKGELLVTTNELATAVKSKNNVCT